MGFLDNIGSLARSAFKNVDQLVETIGFGKDTEFDISTPDKDLDIATSIDVDSIDLTSKPSETALDYLTPGKAIGTIAGHIGDFTARTIGEYKKDLWQTKGEGSSGIDAIYRATIKEPVEGIVDIVKGYGESRKTKTDRLKLFSDVFSNDTVFDIDFGDQTTEGDKHYRNSIEWNTRGIFDTRRNIMGDDFTADDVNDESVADLKDLFMQHGYSEEGISQVNADNIKKSFNSFGVQFGDAYTESGKKQFKIKDITTGDDVKISQKDYFGIIENEIYNHMNKKFFTADDFQNALIDRGILESEARTFDKESMEDMIVSIYRNDDIQRERGLDIIGGATLDSFANTIEDEYGIVDSNNVDDVTNIARFIDNIDLDTTNVNSIKKTITAMGGHTGFVSEINEESIKRMQDKISLFKDDTGIEKIDDAGVITKIDGGYKYTIDASGNVIHKETIGGSLLSRSELALVNEYGADIRDMQELGEEFFKIVSDNNKKDNGDPYSITALQAVSHEAVTAVYDEIHSTAKHLTGTRSRIKKARLNGEDKLADELEAKLKNDIKLFNSFSNNVFDLAKIKLENKLVGIELRDHIEDKYDMSIKDFISRDSSGNVRDFGVRGIVDELISRQVQHQAYYARNSDEYDALSRAYHLIASGATGVTGDLAARIATLQRGTAEAQISDIGGFDPIVGLQSGEKRRQVFNNVVGLTDETIAFLGPDVALGLVTGGVGAASGLLRAGSSTIKGAGAIKTASRMANYADKIADINKYVNGSIRLGNSSRVNKLKLGWNYALNSAKRVAREYNMEVQGNRVDPERGDAWNTKFAVGTMMIPRLFDAQKIGKSIYNGLTGFSEFDMLKHMAGEEIGVLESTTKRLNKDYSDIKGYIRNESIMTADELAKAYGDVSTDGQQAIKANIANGIISNKAMMKNLIMKGRGIDPVDVIVDRPNLLGQSVGSGLKTLSSDEMKQFAKGLIDIVNSPNHNISDMVKYAYDIPGKVTRGDLVSSIGDTPGAGAKLEEAVETAFKQGKISKTNYVKAGKLSGDQTELIVDSVFGRRFMPSSLFTAGDLVKAEKMAEGTHLSVLFGDNVDTFFKKSGNNYRLNDSGLAQLGVIPESNARELSISIGDGDIDGIISHIDRNLGQGVGRQIVEGGTFERVQKILSDKLC